MTTVFDVAHYVLQQKGPMSHMKLQKLVYYCQAWSLVWEEKPIFEDRIEAWANGPVVPALFAQLKGKFIIQIEDLPASKQLQDKQKEVVNKVIDFYGIHDSQWLSDLTHMEKPWQDARKGIAVGARANSEITHASMAEYYCGL
ncbi:DUF4065 domain-containing protein [Telmatocola sphagniphila]|uniref:DUF4065 domain-containing protein n=1 Tax=Telmatocola sphagniphila TaxID=1123043 RepID=A0A8E6B3D7_9BACT|nr:type II toxin-antitoxin system antitoxin SocA domain-containing protein [Telmatocola sphagniphila]QVL31122.1 DUF4065 domain-containing protein [Telmatocola sphagniphila]